MTASKQPLTADFDALQDIVTRRGLASTVRLVARVTATSNRYYQAVANGIEDECYARVWHNARTFLDECALDISQEMRRAV